MRRHSLAVVLFCAPLLLVDCAEPPTDPALVASASRLSAAAGSADRRPADAPLAVLSWQEYARGLVAGHSAISPIAAVRVYALLAVAQYGGIMSTKERGDLGEQGNGWGGDDDFDHGRPHQSLAARGAVAGASAQVLAYLFGGFDDKDAINATIAQRIANEAAAAGGEGASFLRGVDLGRTFGDRIVVRAKADGFVPTVPPTASFPTCPSCWTPARDASGNIVPPAGLQFPKMTPYFLEPKNGFPTTAQFRSVPPPAVTSRAFEDALNEILGFSDLDVNDPVRVAQLAMARGLNYPAGTVTPLGYWNVIASNYIVARGLDEPQAAHVLALTNAAAYDATLGCWESKYYYVYIRPSQAAALISKTINLPIGLPNHPSYPSGHSCVSGAAATVLSAFFPMGKEVFHQQMIDNGNSRMYAGIHYRFDVEAGQALGRSTAEWALKYDRKHGLLAAVR